MIKITDYSVGPLNNSHSRHDPGGGKVLAGGVSRESDDGIMFRRGIFWALPL